MPETAAEAAEATAGPRWTKWDAATVFMAALGFTFLLRAISIAVLCLVTVLNGSAFRDRQYFLPLVAHLVVALTLGYLLSRFPGVMASRLFSGRADGLPCRGVSVRDRRVALSFWIRIWSMALTLRYIAAVGREFWQVLVLLRKTAATPELATELNSMLWLHLAVSPILLCLCAFCAVRSDIVSRFADLASGETDEED